MIGNAIIRLNTAPARFSPLQTVVEKASGVDVAGQLGQIGRGEIARRGVLGEQRGRDLVDALVGALRREDGGNKQLPRVVVTQGAGGAGVHAFQAAQDFGNPGLPFGCGLWRFHVSS